MNIHHVSGKTQELRQNELGRQIRMEQEKIGFKWVRFVKSNLDGICNAHYHLLLF
jgi:hypothetical protein